MLIIDKRKLSIGNNQLIELTEDGSEEVSSIKYIDDCTHLIQFPEDCSELTTMVGLINAAGEIRVEVERISGNTLFYNSTFENDTLRFEQQGAMLKIK